MDITLLFNVAQCYVDKWLLTADESTRSKPSLLEKSREKICFLCISWVDSPIATCQKKAGAFELDLKIYSIFSLLRKNSALSQWAISCRRQLRSNYWRCSLRNFPRRHIYSSRIIDTQSKSRALPIDYPLLKQMKPLESQALLFP